MIDQKEDTQEMPAQEAPEVWTEAPDEAPAAEAPPAPDPAPAVPHYVYAVAMMQDGMLKVVTDLPFDAQRQALPSDVIMTAAYLADVVKTGDSL